MDKSVHSFTWLIAPSKRAHIQRVHFPPSTKSQVEWLAASYEQNKYDDSAALLRYLVPACHTGCNVVCCAPVPRLLHTHSMPSRCTHSLTHTHTHTHTLTHTSSLIHSPTSLKLLQIHFDLHSCLPLHSPMLVK